MSANPALLWQGETPYLIAIALALTALLYRTRPDERGTFRNTLALFGIGLLGQAASLLLGNAEFLTAAEVLRAAFKLVAAIAVIRLSGFALFRTLLPALRLRLPRIIEDLVISAAYVLFAVIQMREAGVDLTGILTASAIMTGVLAFAMQESLGNVLGGLALQLENSIRVGDWVQVEHQIGRVTDIRWRSTSIETANGNTVVVPNSLLMKNRFELIGRREHAPVQTRRWIHFSIDPAEPPARVIAVVESAIQDTQIPNVARHPLPNCVLLGFEHGNLKYGLRYWLTDIAADDPTDSNVRVHLFTALQRVGWRVAEPQETLHNIEVNEQHRQVVHVREVQRRLHFLKNVDLFSTLSDEERRTVAERLQYAPFARGDVLTKQGNTSHWLYIIASGEVEVVVEGTQGERRTLGLLGAGCFFGEMGLMTGAPRTATVIARSDIECYRLDKAAFQDLLITRPALADEISRIVTAREPGLVSARHDILEHAGTRQNEHQGELLERIQRFFGISGSSSVESTKAEV